MLFALLTVLASATPAVHWQASPATTGRVVAQDHVACMRSAMVREPGKNLRFDATKHASCMTELGWTPVARPLTLARKARKARAQVASTSD